MATVLLAFPTGDRQAKLVHDEQPITFAAMEGHFHTAGHAPLVLIGQPNMEKLELDNPVHLPGVLSFLTHQRWEEEIRGLTEWPEEEWPTNVEILYYAYHVMAGLGTLFIGIMALAAWGLKRGKLYGSRRLLWVLLLAAPFPYVANTAGWMTAELGRQPWVIHGLMRTADGFSAHVSAGNVTFTLIGFMGIYSFLSVLFLSLVGREIAKGPGKS